MEKMKNGFKMRHGFRVEKQVLDEADIHPLRQAIDEALDRAARALLAPYETSRPGDELEDRIERAARLDRAYAFTLLHAVTSDTQRDPRLEALKGHPKLSAIAEDLVAPERVTSRVIRVRASVPLFDSDRTHWHQDVSRIEKNDKKKSCEDTRLAFWMPLTDVDKNTGALEVMPGRWKRPLPHRPAQDGRFVIPENRLPDRPKRVVPVRRGDALVLDRFIPHRALPARHGRARWAVVMWVQACAEGVTRP